MLKRKGKSRRRRLAVRLVLAGIAALAAFEAVSCIPPKSFRAVKQPRAGRVLGGRVAIVYSKHYQINMAGFERLHPHPQKYSRVYLSLVTQGLINPADVFVPDEVTEEQVLRVHSRAFLASLKDSNLVARYLEVPPLASVPNGLIDAGVLSAFRRSTGGTILAGRLALQHGVAVNLAGGYHHAKPDAGEGFCIYNDLAIAVRTLQAEGLIRRALVVDLDVHQGNGTAVIFGPDSGDDEVFAFSMHQAGVYPIPKETGDLDVELAAGDGDDEYLRLLAKHLPSVLQQARPDIVFVQAGADTLAGDPLAGLAMTPQGIVRRDAMVIDRCVADGIPVVVTLGGGYRKDAWAAQAASVARTIDKHGLRGLQPYPQRKRTIHEKMYTK